MHAALSRFLKISAQMLVILVVPGGVIMIIVYQYRRFQKRRIPSTDRDMNPPQSPSN